MLPPADDPAALAAVAERARHLFADGYRASVIDDYTVEVTSPAGDTYEIDTLFANCTCPYFALHRGRLDCKHTLGYEKLLEDQERDRELRLRGGGP